MSEIKFEKIITVNDTSHQVLSTAVQQLLVCMEETNQKHSVHTEYFRLRLKDSEKSPFGKDLLLEWVCI